MFVDFFVACVWGVCLRLLADAHWPPICNIFVPIATLRGQYANGEYVPPAKSMITSQQLAELKYAEKVRPLLCVFVRI